MKFSFLARAVLLLITVNAGTLFCDQAESVLFAPPADLEARVSYQKILQAEPNTPAYEKAKIDYLLDRLAQSSYDFLRRGIHYSGRRAAAHLRWKYLRRREEVRTAEDFVSRIASISRTTGEPYLVEMPDGQLYSCRELMEHELQLLNQALAARENSLKETPAPDDNNVNTTP